MFLNREGNPLKAERLRVYFRRYRRKAGISEEFIVHSLRHSFATKLIEEGVPLVQVKEKKKTSIETGIKEGHSELKFMKEIEKVMSFSEMRCSF